MILLEVPYFKQEKSTTCGPACLRMITAFEGMNYSEGGENMEVYEKIRRYLYENIGHLTTPATPKFDVKRQIWKVPVLCKTERGILIAGEFQLDKEGNFIYIPTKQEMERVVKYQIEKLPFLFYGKKTDIEKKEVEVVSI